MAGARGSPTLPPTTNPPTTPPSPSPGAGKEQLAPFCHPGSLKRHQSGVGNSTSSANKVGAQDDHHSSKEDAQHSHGPQKRQRLEQTEESDKAPAPEASQPVSGKGGKGGKKGGRGGARKGVKKPHTQSATGQNEQRKTRNSGKTCEFCSDTSSLTPFHCSP